MPESLVKKMISEQGRITCRTCMTEDSNECRHIRQRQTDFVVVDGLTVAQGDTRCADYNLFGFWIPTDIVPPLTCSGLQGKDLKVRSSSRGLAVHHSASDVHKRYHLSL